MRTILKNLFFAVLILTATNAFAQVGIGTNTPAASAALEVSSSTNNKGILIPRITVAQKDAISNPAEGLMIYQTSAPTGFYYYTGTAWKLMVTQTDLDTKVSTVDAIISLDTKVDKVTGKVLSSNDFTSAEKTKVSNLSGTNSGDQDLSALATVASVALKANAADLTSGLATKVDKEIGKVLSSNDFTSAEKTKLAAITGTNTGDNAVNFLYSGLISNATHTGDVTGSTALTIADNAVTSSKIADNQIINTKIMAGAITDVKITDVAATKITGTVAIANGGNGLTSTPAIGQLDIGNGAGFTRTTLTAGTGISVTNNPGSITITNSTPGLPTTGNSAGDMLYWNGTDWVKVTAGSEGQTLFFKNQIPTWGKLLGAIISDVVPGAGEILGISGRIWMDRNLGASQAATSPTDYLAYGDLYQWGRGSDGHEKITWTSSSAGTPVNSTTSTFYSDGDIANNLFITAPYNVDWRTTSDNNLWQGINGVNNPCPTGFRIPTKIEWQNERQDLGLINLTSPGFRYSFNNYVIMSPGEQSAYWSSTIGNQPNQAFFMDINFYDGRVTLGAWPRSWGLPIRCIKD